MSNKRSIKKTDSDPNKIAEEIRRILETPFWIREIEQGKSYARLHDDHEGTFEGRLSIIFMDDAWIKTTTRDKSIEPTALRFRNYLGGGRSPRVYRALQILALAIKLDNEEDPLPGS